MHVDGLIPRLKSLTASKKTNKTNKNNNFIYTAEGFSEREYHTLEWMHVLIILKECETLK